MLAALFFTFTFWGSFIRTCSVHHIFLKRLAQLTFYLFLLLLFKGAPPSNHKAKEQHGTEHVQPIAHKEPIVYGLMHGNAKERC